MGHNAKNCVGKTYTVNKDSIASEEIVETTHENIINGSLWSKTAIFTAIFVFMFFCPGIM